MENLLIYGSIFDMLDELTNEEAGLLFKALNSFRKGEEVEFEDRYLKGIWKGILPNLNKLKENYDVKVKANQENGKRGGRPKKLNDGVEPSKPSTKKEAIEATISTEVIEEDQVDIIVPQNEDNEEIKDIKLNDLTPTNIRELSEYKSIYQFYIPKLLIPYMNLIEGKLGLENRLKRKTSQINFNIELLDLMKGQHNKIDYLKEFVS